MKKILLVAFVIMANSAWSSPSLYVNCPDVHIQPVPNGNGVYLDKDCHTAYVLPPLTGALSITGLAPNLNISRCQEAESIYESKVALAERLAALTKRLVPKAKPRRQEADDNGLFDPIDDDSDTPTDDGEADLRKTKADLEKIQGISALLDSSVKELSSIEGVNAEVHFINDQQALVKAYQERNPTLNFTAMPLSQARLTFARKVANNSASLPAALDIQVSGLTVMPGFANPTEHPGLIFGSALSGRISLSLNGACPLYDSARHKMKVNALDGKTLGTYFAADVAYVYNLRVNRSYTAKYNIASFFHRLQTSESSGGLFSSSTVNRLIEERDSKDWFEFHSNSDDPRQEFEDSLRETIKAQLVDRVFKQIQLIAGSSGDAAPGLTTPKPDGASVAAKNLEKCPYAYCQIGGAVLEIADALFGSSSTVSEYIKNNNYWADEVASEDKMLPFIGTMVFGK